MSSAALRFVPVEWRFVILACGAALLVLASGVYTGLQLHAPTITRTVHVGAPIGSASAAEIAAAWRGRPVDPAQLNLPASVKCVESTVKHALICYAQ